MLGMKRKKKEKSTVCSERLQMSLIRGENVPRGTAFLTCTGRFVKSLQLLTPCTPVPTQLFSSQFLFPFPWMIEKCLFLNFWLHKITDKRIYYITVPEEIMCHTCWVAEDSELAILTSCMVSISVECSRSAGGLADEVQMWCPEFIFPLWLACLFDVPHSKLNTYTHSTHESFKQTANSPVS